MNLKLLLVGIFAMLLIGCTNEIREIPAGFVGKKLTPSGWDKGILEAGQTDIGAKNNDGTYTSLVTLEATSVSTKESFGQSGGANGEEDHRVLIGKTPVSVDVYVRMMVPKESEKRNAIFAQVTPKSIGDRTSSITVTQIYEQFAKMDIRSGIREVLQKQTDVNYINTHFDEFNDKLGAMAIRMFERSGVPLLVQNVTLSNVKMDQSVWEAENQKTAALAQVEAITKIGTALRANPEYALFKKYDTYEKIKDKIGSFTIIEGNPNGIVIK
jgi:hypothetical protein